MVELMDPDEVAVNEAKFSETLLEETVKTVSEGEVNLDEIQILSESVHFSKDVDAFKAMGTRESLRRIRNHYIDLTQEFHYLATATLTCEQLRKAATDLQLPPPVVSTPLTHAIIHHDVKGVNRRWQLAQKKLKRQRWENPAAMLPTVNCIKSGNQHCTKCTLEKVTLDVCSTRNIRLRQP